MTYTPATLPPTEAVLAATEERAAEEFADAIEAGDHLESAPPKGDA